MTVAERVETFGDRHRASGGAARVLATALRMAAVFLAALILQITLFVDVRVAGVAPDLMALIAAAAGIMAGPQRGSLVAFIAGLLWDVFLPTPLGLSAVSFALVAYVVGLVTAGLLKSTRFQTALLVAGATAVSLVFYALLGELVGQSGLLELGLVRIVVMAALLNGMLSHAAVPLVRWALS